MLDKNEIIITAKETCKKIKKSRVDSNLGKKPYSSYTLVISPPNIMG